MPRAAQGRTQAAIPQSLSTEATQPYCRHTLSIIHSYRHQLARRGLKEAQPIKQNVPPAPRTTSGAPASHQLPFQARPSRQRSVRSPRPRHVWACITFLLTGNLVTASLEITFLLVTRDSDHSTIDDFPPPPGTSLGLPAIVG